MNEVEFSGDEGVPFDTGTLIASNLAEMKVCLLPWNTIQVELSGDESVPYAPGTLMKSNLVR
jgi:hypothetical protein